MEWDVLLDDGVFVCAVLFGLGIAGVLLIFNSIADIVAIILGYRSM